MKKTLKKREVFLTTLCMAAGIFTAQSQVHESPATQSKTIQSKTIQSKAAASTVVGKTWGSKYDILVTNKDNSNHFGQVRMQTGNKAFTFSNFVNRMSLSYAHGTNHLSHGNEIFKVTTTGNTTMNNAFVGEVGHGSRFAGFTHKSQTDKQSYSFLAENTGKHTFINKKNTGNGFIGFRVGNIDKMVITNDGDIGIGTTSPNQKLDVAGLGRFSKSLTNFLEMGHGGTHSFLNHNGVGNIDFRYQGTNLMTLTQNGNLGIGTSNPNGELHLPNTEKNRKIVLHEGVDNDHNFYGFGVNTNALRYQSSANHVFYSYVDANMSKEVFRINNDGKVVIGQSQLSSSTEDANTLLTVSGGIKTDKVVLNIGSFPDYVFEDDYALMPIEEVSTYIAENKHLPNIPSEKEMVATGLDVNMISLKLVEKIEELTLYTIEQHQAIDEQKEMSTKQQVLMASQQELIKKQQITINKLAQRIEKLENSKY